MIYLNWNRDNQLNPHAHVQAELKPAGVHVIRSAEANCGYCYAAHVKTDFAERAVAELFA